MPQKRPVNACKADQQLSSNQLAPSGNQRVVTLADVWAQLYTPPFRIWQQPQKLFACALISQAYGC